MASWAHLEPKYSSPPVLLPSLRSYVSIGTCVEVGDTIFRLLGRDGRNNLIGNVLVPLSDCEAISTPHATTGPARTYKEVVQTTRIEPIIWGATVEVVLVQTTEQLEEHRIGDASTFVRHIRFREDGSKIQDWNDFPCSHPKYPLIDCSIVRFIYEGLACLADSIGHILNKRQIRECDRRLTEMNPACWSFLKRYFESTKIETSPNFSTKRKRLEEGFVQRLYKCERRGEYLRLSTRRELDQLANLLGPTALCGIRRQPQKDAWVLGEEGLVNVVYSNLEQREDYNMNGDWVRRTHLPGIDLFSDGHVARLYVRYRLVTINKGDEWPSDYLKKCAAFSLFVSKERSTPPILIPGSQYEDDDNRLFEVLQYDPSRMVAVVMTEDNIPKEVGSIDELNDIAERINKYLE